MIEIIYDKNEEKKENDVREEAAASDAGGNDGGSSEDMKLPKNVRQIGTPNLNKRIYIEDYVVTYLNYLAKPGNTHARGAILLGECKKTSVGDIIFISGAIDAQNIELDMDESKFTQEIWTDIYNQIKESFPEQGVVGWFLSRIGFSTAINDKIEKMHVDNFPGRDKVLYITDSLECDDAFYMYERGQLVKQKGYYIYYMKNEAMQNYIIKQKGGKSEEDNTEIHRKDEEIIKNYRSKNHQTRGKKTGGVSVVYLASSFVVLAMLAMGISVINNYDKMKEMEISINRLELTTSEAGYTEVMAEDSEATATNGTETATSSNAGTEVTTEITTQETTTQETTAATTETISTEQTLPAATNGNPTYYTVKYGDTLGSISMEMYGSTEYAAEIAKANNMNVDDRIFEGQKLVIPTVN